MDDLQGISSAYIQAKDQDLTTVLNAASRLVSFDPPQLKQEGIKLFEHAVALSPTSVDARLGLASTLYQMGETERAQKIYREVLEQHPNEVRALNDLAWILQEHERRYEAALELANRGLQLMPDDSELLDTRGTILSNLPNRLTEARDDFARLAERLPTDTRAQARALLQLGRVCVKLKDLAQAKVHLQSALEIDRKVNAFTLVERTEIASLIEQGSI
jgi:tetratricopeptide (TPR) repeat protein